MLTPNLSIDSSTLNAMIDRLVSNDIDETQRTQLLTYLESNQQHWRSVVIAFLEAQAWEQSFAMRSVNAASGQSSNELMLTPMLAATESTTAANHVLAVAETTSHTSQSRWNSLLKLAAMLLFAFGLGSFTMQSISSRYLALKTQNQSIATTEYSNIETTTASLESKWVWASVPWSDPQIPIAGVRLQIPVRVSGGNASKPIFETTSMPIRLSDYEKQLMSRRGLDISTSQRFVNATLPDGSDIAIPIERLVAKQIEPRVN
jgi:hypothetical protein